MVELLGTILAKAHDGDPWAALELIANVTANVPDHKLKDEAFLRASIIHTKGIAKACLRERERQKERTLITTGQGDDEKLLNILAEKLHDEMEHLEPMGTSWHLLPPHKREFFVTCVERVLIELACLPLEETANENYH